MKDHNASPFARFPISNALREHLLLAREDQFRDPKERYSDYERDDRRPATALRMVVP